MSLSNVNASASGAKTMAQMKKKVMSIGESLWHHGMEGLPETSSYAPGLRLRCAVLYSMLEHTGPCGMNTARLSERVSFREAGGCLGSRRAGAHRATIVFKT
jgi:hypothetical protein